MNEPQRTLRGSLECVEWTSGFGDPEAVVVLLHGFGAPGDDLVGLAPALASEKSVRFVFPAATLSPPDMAAWAGRAWWSLRLSELIPQLAGGDFEALTAVVPPELPEARDAALGCVEAVREEFGGGPLVLGGFSQGAMLAADVAVRTDLTPAALVLLSGAPLASSNWADAGRLSIPTFVSHGRFDEVLPFGCGELLRDRLASPLGCEVTFRPFDSGHTIPQEVIGDLRRFLTDVLQSH